MNIYLHCPAPAGLVYWKYGPTPDYPAAHWYEFMYDGRTGAVIEGDVISLYFVDGERDDDDLVGDGVIIDQGGPGIVAPSAAEVSVPTLSEWGMILLASLCMGVYFVDSKTK